MAATKVIVYLFTVLVPLAIVFSEDAPSLPNIPGLPNLPSLPNLPNLPGLPSPSSGNSSDDEGDDGSHQDRLFFTIPQVTSCNFTAEPGRTCRGCYAALTCLSSNVGIIRYCRGLFRYCNQGRCSLYQGSACTSTNSTG